MAGLTGLKDGDVGLTVLRRACTLAADPPSPRNRQVLSQFWALKQRQTEIARLRGG